MTWYQLNELRQSLRLVLAQDHRQLDCLDIATDVVTLSDSDVADTIADLQVPLYCHGLCVVSPLVKLCRTWSCNSISICPCICHTPILYHLSVCPGSIYLSYTPAMKPFVELKSQSSVGHLCPPSTSIKLRLNSHRLKRTSMNLVCWPENIVTVIETTGFTWRKPKTAMPRYTVKCWTTTCDVNDCCWNRWVFRWLLKTVRN